MKRKIYDQLLLWKNKRKGKSAMMIEGDYLYIPLYMVPCL